MSSLTADFIGSAGVDLLLKEPFFAHLLSSLPRVIADETEIASLEWSGVFPILSFNPNFPKLAGSSKQQAGWIKHLLLHVVFKHLLRKTGSDVKIHNIAADLVVSQLISPWPQIPQAITLDSFPELELKADQTLEYYYKKLTELLIQRNKSDTSSKKKNSEKQKTKDEKQEGKATGSPDKSKKNKNENSIGKLNEILNKNLCGDLKNEKLIQGTNTGNAIEFKLESLCLRAVDRTPIKDRGTIPLGLLRILGEFENKFNPALDWRRALKLFTTSSWRTKLSHTIKKTSKRYGTRPGVKIKKLQLICVAVDTSGSVNDIELKRVFNEIFHIWRSGADVSVIECDSAIHQVYPYRGKVPKPPKGGGGTDFNPVCEWINTQSKFDALIYLTDGLAPEPSIKPRCPILWLILPGNDKVQFAFGKCVLMEKQ